MHLHDLLGWTGPMTARQFDAWQAWLAIDMNTPSRTDHYLMALRLDNAREGTQLDDLKIKFYDPDDPAENPWYCDVAETDPERWARWEAAVANARFAIAANSVTRAQEEKQSEPAQVESEFEKKLKAKMAADKAAGGAVFLKECEEEVSQ